MSFPEPIYRSQPRYPSCHAATLVELPDGHLLAAWFAGTHEGHPDVAIWLARFDGDGWSKPTMVADEPSVPLWNPVLFWDKTDTVWLFYKAAPAVPAWTGVYIKSFDGGQSWSTPAILPAGLLGPAKNKPIALSNGDTLCGTSSESWRSWACWVEISSDGGQNWSKHGPITAPGPTERETGTSELTSATLDAASHRLVLPQEHYGVIQPTVWEYAPGRLRMLMRATRPVGVVCTSSSDDYGHTWSPASRTGIPNPNSGLDAVRLRDGRIVLACNPVWEGRTPLSLLVSEDNGETWPWRQDVETGRGEYSYPSIIQTTDGHVHVVYTYRRSQIRHLIMDPDRLVVV
jgi:predicted neuraminidase